MRVMGRLVLCCIVTGYVSISAAQRSSRTAAPTCSTADVTVVTATPTLKAGTRPQFSVVVTNKSRDPIRVLDVRNGRRVDLQHNYFELFIVEGPRLVDLPIAISDPGAVADADFTVLKPGERIEVGSLSYTRAAEELPPGKYSAFILFGETHTCRIHRGAVRAKRSSWSRIGSTASLPTGCIDGSCAQNVIALGEAVAVSPPAVRRWSLFGA
jgi:hypothetical protein